MKFEFNMQESNIILKALKRYDDELGRSSIALEDARKSGIQDLDGIILDVAAEMVFTEDLIRNISGGQETDWYSNSKHGGNSMNTGEIVEELIYIKDHAPLLPREVKVIEEACNLLDKLLDVQTAISTLEK